MPLNKSKGNMYGFVTHTFNTIKGACPHDCDYCYMKRRGTLRTVRFDEKEKKTDLGKNNVIFVGSSCDMWAADIPEKWILDTLDMLTDDNVYLFQSKNPLRFGDFRRKMRMADVLATTIESNRKYSKGSVVAPDPKVRAIHLTHVAKPFLNKMVTIEPIMDFDFKEMVDMIDYIQPQLVAIGANTRTNVTLAEPPPAKIEKLILALREFTKVHLKPNLKRLYWEGK